MTEDRRRMEFRNIRKIVEIGISRVNPGWVARKYKERPNLHGLTLHLCPECKRPLGESDANEVLKKCNRCEVWIHLKKRR